MPRLYGMQPGLPNTETLCQLGEMDSDTASKNHHNLPYRRLADHYEACLARHGDSHLGVDWPNAEDAATRYRVMLDVAGDLQDAPASLLDVGCGAGHLLEFIRATDQSFDYRGLDISKKFVELCRRKFPETTFHHADLLEDANGIDPADYLVLNGVFTEKLNLSQDDMTGFMHAMLTAAWSLAAKGLAFNVMSAQVDWQRDDLFHAPFDAMADFLTKTLTRRFVFRQDYGLYEYTVYLYR